MSSIANFPNPCLVAILLVCNTRHGSGAQILFHHPPSPLSGKPDQLRPHSVVDDFGGDTSSDTSISSTDEDELFALPQAQARIHSNSKRRSTREDEPSPTRTDSISHNEKAGSTVEPLLGLGEDGLVSLLSPDRTWHKRKFELGINNLTFVGRPVYVRHDGTWIKRKKKGRTQSKPHDAPSDSLSPSEDEQRDGASRASGDATTNLSQSQPVKSVLTMFHVVFVMNPPPLEHTSRVKDMYDHVIKKFSRALKWEQVHNDYVRKQAELILSLKSSGSISRLSKYQVSAQILEKSSLATAISTVYNAIANSRIASVTLSPTVSVSLQIPPITSTAYLPSLTDPPIQPGLWLTTATDIGASMSDPDNSSTPSSHQLAKHYTLLLKSPPHRIAKDAHEAGGPIAQHLPKLLSALRPTKSFYKLQVASQLSLVDIQLLARHLIYWRRAVAIPPLHQGDIYIVSPNADLRKLPDAIKAYEREFPPTMPSLPKMLSALSGIPRPFGVLIPSSDHKEIYYFALAWLMRNGWVTQLRTFAYIRVQPDMKRAVRSQDRESRPRASNGPVSKDHSDESRETMRSRMKRPSIVSHSSSDGRRSIEGGRSLRNEKMASLILNPPRASALESKWLDFIGEALSADDNKQSRLSREERVEIRKYWPMFVKYFNGQIALQTVPVRENLKRKFVWGLLDKFGLSLQGGVEDENGENKRLLVAVRHW